ncbi:MAG: hypothetical protein KGY67_08205 [Candidatus Thermoplasmatota archaeon]|nr:hypothetical protein [Candidatus Thermoplasmatota archaeon]
MKQKKISISAQMFKNIVSEDTLRILQILDKHSFSLEELKERTTIPLNQLKPQLTKLKQGNIVKEKNYRQKRTHYSLTFKGSSLLHPENQRILILSSVSIVALLLTIGSLVQRFIHSLQTPQDPMRSLQETNSVTNDGIGIFATETGQQINDPTISSAIMIGLILCIVLTSITLWIYRKNKSQAL